MKVWIVTRHHEDTCVLLGIFTDEQDAKIEVMQKVSKESDPQITTTTVFGVIPLLSVVSYRSAWRSEYSGAIYTINRTDIVCSELP